METQRLKISDYWPKFSDSSIDTTSSLIEQQNLEVQLTAAAKNVLSPISESTVMASDLLNP